MSTGVTLVLVLALASVLVLAMDRVDRVVPRGSRLEAWVQRWAATGQALVVLASTLWIVEILFRADTQTWRWLTTGVLVVAAWASRRSLTDWASGVMLKSEGTLRPGGRIGVDAGRGRIRRLGLRSAEVEVEDGRVLRLPYTGLAAAAIEITPEETAARSHTFTVHVATLGDAAELSERMTTGALLSAWSSAQPTPTVRLLARGDEGLRFEVTVYPVDPAFASKVEEAVRASVGPATG
jgi:small-conductance mechanosensitive channel